jgi:hypothetical protein
VDLWPEQLPQRGEIVDGGQAFEAPQGNTVAGGIDIGQQRLDAVEIHLDIGSPFVVAPAGPHQVAILAFDFSGGDLLRQAQAGVFGSQGLILADAALHLAGRRNDASRMVPRHAEPVDADAVFHTLADGLCTDLRETVQ